ncbi:hypothetical protein MMC29_003821 [Sticta canariensis]|nr:hypothetical protein [Sticta canariensis]
MHELKRLHISPFSPELLPIILPADISQRASNVSFHAIQTSQERNYGYVDLPEMDAEKVRKRFNGAILKGSKMRVEDARPEKSRRISAAQNAGRSEISLEDGPSEESQTQGRKKHEKVDGVMTGIELPEGRKVKRGWTEPAAALKSSKTSKDTNAKHTKKLKPNPSRFTNERECLFKTKLPPNAVASNTKAVKRKRGQSGGNTVVHEFEHTTKHATFLRESKDSIGSEGAVEYAEGKGWMDRNGRILEEGTEMRRTRPKLNKGKDVPSTTKNEHDSHPAAHKISKIPSIRVNDSAKPDEAADIDDETSSSGTSSSSAGDSDGKSYTTPAQRNDDTDGDAENSASPLPSGEEAYEGNIVQERVRAMSVSNNPLESQANHDFLESKQPIDEVHPLEALFKRPKIAASSTPKKPTLEVSTSFNFFDHDAEEGSSNGYLAPHTPFTQQDIRERRQRSAAPTPDTAAPGKSFGNMWVSRSESGEEEEGGEEKEAQSAKEAVISKSISAKEHGGAQGADSEERPESDFSKWFWEHRGETNRAWKRRRREAAKEKRQTDDKKT